MGKPRKARWYVKNGLAIFGPLTSPEMRKLVEEGIITADSLIGKEKGNHWAPATKVQGLFRETDAIPDGEAELRLLPLELAGPGAARNEDGWSYALEEETPPLRKAKWYVKNGRAILGPLTSPEMRDLAEQGIITADSLVGKGKGNRWGPATKVKGLLPKADAVPDAAPDGAWELGPAPDESAGPAAAGDGDDSIYAIRVEPPPPSSQALKGLSRKADAIPDGQPLPAPPPPQPAGPAATGVEDDLVYAVREEPPPPSSQAMALSPTSEADEPSMPLGYRRFIDDDPKKKRRKWKWLPNFSVSFLGMTINQDTLVVWGLVAGFMVLVVLTCALVSWCPRRSQRVLEARAVALVHPLPAAALVRDDRGGDTLVVKLRLSKRFLREKMGAHDEASAGKDAALVSQSDFHLVSDNTETTARGFLGMEEKRSPWETPLDPGSPYHIESSLPQLGNTKANVSGTVKPGDSTTQAPTDRGSVTATVSGDMKGQVTVGPITRNLSITGLRATRGLDGLSIMGRVEGKLPDDVPVSFEYIGDACEITWSGAWLGFGSVGGSFQTPLAERWYDKTVDVYCVFNRPRGASKLSVRYKDALPITLSPSLAGPPK